MAEKYSEEFEQWTRSKEVQNTLSKLRRVISEELSSEFEDTPWFSPYGYAWRQMKEVLFKAYNAGQESENDLAKIAYWYGYEEGKKRKSPVWSRAQSKTTNINGVSIHDEK